MSDKVTVVIATYNNAKTLSRAVESVLNQSYKNLQCIVMNDGAQPDNCWKSIEHIDDRRVVRFNLEENRGRFYADAVALGACSTKWFHPHDSDDYSDPMRIENMLKAADATQAQIVAAGMTIHNLDGTRTLRMPPIIKGGRGREHAKDRVVYSEVNYGTLWETDALRSIGGPHPDYRFAYDTMLGNLAVKHLRWTLLWDYGYHYVRRKGSLTTDKKTGLQTQERQAAWTAREALWTKLEKQPLRKLARHTALQPKDKTKECLKADQRRLRLEIYKNNSS